MIFGKDLRKYQDCGTIKYEIIRAIRAFCNFDRLDR